MNLDSRISKLEQKLLPQGRKIYVVGWANCGWNLSEGITREKGESRDAFCKRIHRITKKQLLWFY